MGRGEEAKIPLDSDASKIGALNGFCGWPLVLHKQGLWAIVTHRLQGSGTWGSPWAWIECSPRNTIAHVGAAKAWPEVENPLGQSQLY